MIWTFRVILCVFLFLATGCNSNKEEWKLNWNDEYDSMANYTLIKMTKAFYSDQCGGAVVYSELLKMDNCEVKMRHDTLEIVLLEKKTMDFFHKARISIANSEIIQANLELYDVHDQLRKTRKLEHLDLTIARKEKNRSITEGKLKGSVSYLSGDNETICINLEGHFIYL